MWRHGSARVNAIHKCGQHIALVISGRLEALGYYQVCMRARSMRVKGALGEDLQASFSRSTFSYHRVLQLHYGVPQEEGR